MIPIRYALREEARFQKDHNAWLAISEIPLNVMRINDATYRMLKACDGTSALAELAYEYCGNNEETAFTICEYFRNKGILELSKTIETDYLPSIAVIIPTRDRQNELQECLESVLSQNYPAEKREVIVIDDGSKDDTAYIVKKFSCTFLAHKETRGQSFCRNKGAQSTHAEILAFLDSDCVADKNWFNELACYFQWDAVGAVGGYVDVYGTESTLDRYEETCSPLNMGKRFLYDIHADSTFYVPTCNLLVRKDAFSEIGGFREGMHVGEDVDFCWRLHKLGYRLLYIPHGIVRHKHRNRLHTLLMRRADYGTSEAILYNLHREKKKTFQVPPFAAMSYLLIVASIILLSPWFLIFSIVPVLLDVTKKSLHINKQKVKITPFKVFFSVIRSHFSFYFFISFHIARYYLIVLIIFGFLWYSLWFFSAFTISVTSIVDYSTKKPQLPYPIFLFYYIVEHLAYQIGVFAGCLKRRKFRSYCPRFSLKTAKIF